MNARSPFPIRGGPDGTSEGGLFAETFKKPPPCPVYHSNSRPTPHLPLATPRKPIL